MLLRLFAPFIVYATEEVYSWTHTESVHRQPWPTVSEIAEAIAPDRREGADDGVFQAVSDALITFRRAKTEAKVKMRTPIVTATLHGPADRVGSPRRRSTICAR